MKKLLVACFALTLLLPEAAQAQSHPVDRGSWIVGGNASLISRSNDADDGRTTSAFLSPRAQYFVRPGLALGGNVSFSYSSGDDLSTTGIGVGPTVSYYFGRDIRPVYPFVSASFSVIRLSIKFDFDVPEFERPPEFDTNLDETTTSYIWDLSAGAVVMIAKNVGLTGAVFYQQQNVDRNNDLLIVGNLDSNAFGLRFGVQVLVF